MLEFFRFIHHLSSNLLKVCICKYDLLVLVHQNEYIEQNVVFWNGSIYRERGIVFRKNMDMTISILEIFYF
jgi:hypothetical protein